MKSAWGVVALAFMTCTGACGSSAHADAGCPYDAQQLVNVPEPAGSYTRDASTMRHTADAWQTAWGAELVAMQKELGLPADAADEDAVLAKLDADAKSLKAAGCTLAVDATADAPATTTPRVAKVTYTVQCNDEAKVKATLDRTRALVDAHFPALIGLSAEYADLVPRRKALLDRGWKLVQALQSDPPSQWIVKCGSNLVVDVDDEAKAAFRVKAIAAALGERPDA